MKQVNYIKERDELEVVFKETEVPSTIQLKNSISLEFNEKDELSAIIMPNFLQMIHRPYTPDLVFSYEDMSFFDENMVLTIKINDQKVNVKCDLSELEN